MVEINLLPAQYRKRSEPSVWRYAAMALPVATVLGIVIFSAVQGTRLGNIQRELADNTGQIDGLAATKSQYDALLLQKTDLQKTTDVSKTLQASKTYWSSDLARFVNALPTGSGVALSALNMKAVDSNILANYTQQGLYNGKPVSMEFDLTGQAASSQSLVNFLNSFENNPNFGVNFKGAQRTTTAVSAPGSLTTTSQPDGASTYSFTATVGLIGQPASATATTPATSGTSGSAPAVGGSNVR